MNAITAPPPIMDGLNADVSTPFDLLDDDGKEQLLHHWQQVL